ncbi:MAG: diaminopimelate epimerase [Bacteroidota bacterium]
MNSKVTFPFWKYQGTGNDFVLVDNRRLDFPKTDVDFIHQLCDRRLGIGADGLILLENDDLSDFRMVYFNSDGNESSMCGNGGRCIVGFAQSLGIIEAEATFNAVDGTHKAKIIGEQVELEMIDIDTIKDIRNYSFLNTGSPHHVQLVKNLNTLNVRKEGAKIRYGIYGETGSNINFVEQESDAIFNVRTYERGVEDETLSCGTGVTAVALAMYHSGKTNAKTVIVKTRGGDLKVQFTQSGGVYTNVRLSGPATKVFKGQWQT